MQLNESQRLAAEWPQGHLLVIAGAGSGKTRTIIARTQKLIADGVPPHRIALLTFTRRAAAEMIERLKITGNHDAGLINAGTFHYFSLLMMRRHPHLFGNSNFMVIDRDDQEQIMKLARAKHSEDNRLLPKSADLLNIFSYARNSYLYLEDYLKKYYPSDPLTRTQIIETLADYQKEKERMGYLDFDDLLFFFLQKLENPDSGTYFRSLYDYILVDEIQDTNPLQWAILTHLINPAVLFCVGDDAQSIYAFRGADFRNVHEFQNRVPDSSVIRLEKNYRSTCEILTLANTLLERSPLNYGKHLESVKGSGEPVKVKDFSDDYAEARWLVNDLRQNVASGTAWKEQMILVRTAYSAKTTEAVMIEQRIPYRFIGGTGLLQSAHIKDLICFCRAALNPQDTLAWVRYLSMWEGIGERRAVKTAQEIAACPSLTEAMTRISKIPFREQIMQGCLNLLSQSDSVSALLQGGVDFLSPLMERIYEDTWLRRVRDFEILINLARKYKNLREFTDTYTLDPVSSSVAQHDEGADLVRLITIHSAKGTEADICYLIQAQSGNFPHRRSLGDEDAEEEERRILYVAVTRARNRLIITRSTGNSFRHAGGYTPPASRPENQYFLDGIANISESDTYHIPTKRIGNFPFFRQRN